MDVFARAERAEGLTRQEIATAVERSLSGRSPSRALLIPPDFTRYHSNAGLITNLYYHLLAARGCEADVLPALGTHAPVTREEARVMFGDIPFERFLTHSWREGLVTLGDVPGAYIASLTDGLWREPISAQISAHVMDARYGLIISIGQVVPHEVIGMANHAKNLFVGVGGSDMINKSHMIGAVYGMERMMGRDHTPVREIFDYALNHYLKDRPILFALTVCTAPGGNIRTHGLFIGQDRACLEQAISLSQEKNIDFVPHGLKKCVVYLDPSEFHSTWLGNKAVYRTRMAMADGGELLVLAPGVGKFGEDAQVDALIRKYGYRGRVETLRAFQAPENQDLRDNMGAAAHLIHGSSDGRFSITYAVQPGLRADIESVGYASCDYAQTASRYDPQKLAYGANTLPDGEEIFFIPNPALGLWINKERFT